MTHEPAEEEIHLRDYIKVIRKRLNTVVIFFILTFTVVLIATLAATPIYQAGAKVLIKKSQDSSLDSTGGYYSRFDPSFEGTQVELIKSYNVASRVVKALALVNTTEQIIVTSWLSPVKSFILALLPTSTVKTGSPTAASEQISDEDLLAYEIMESITVSPIRNSQIFKISYHHPDPVIAQKVVNATAKAYMDEVLEMKMASVGYTLQWMTEKAAEEMRKLETSEKAMQQYMADSKIVTLQNKIAVLPEKLSDFSSKLSEAVTKQNKAAIIYNKVLKAGNNFDKIDAILDISANTPLLQTLTQQLLDTKQKYTELSKRYGPKHPKMININGEITSLTQTLESEKEKELQRRIKLLKSKTEVGVSQVANLQQIVDQTKKEAQRFNQKMIQYGMLQRDVEINRALYQSLLTQIKEKKVTEQTSNINIWIIEEAKNPRNPASPKKARNLLLGIILGLFGGIGLAFFIEYLDNTIGSPDEAESRLGVSVLGVIDQFRNDEFDPEKGTMASEFSSFSESFKSIRTAILLSAADQPPKKIVITSMLPQEGKTTTTVNLARTFAQTEYKVLIIDGDLRKPRIHKIFATDNSTGLSTYLAGVEGDKIIHKVKEENNLFIIPSGPIPPNPSELLVSDKFKALLTGLEEKFDFIFIDSAPLFSATETLLLGQAAEGTLMVAKAGKSTYEILTSGFRSLNESGAHPLGLVINALNRKRSGYGYGSYYGGRYYKYSAYYTPGQNGN
ncbi:MAG: polysaccharide biosynthesis tyrosine autokinase [Thermodesulfobacteriota bacterium]